MSRDRTGLLRPGIDYNFIRLEYGEQVRKAGGEPVFLDNFISPAAAVRLCQGFIISGGEDIDPSLYGQEPKHIKLAEPIERTLWERQLIDECDSFERPILGICYGAQLLNVHYGGTLYQDIQSEQGSAMGHGTSTKAALHTVTFEHNLLGYQVGEQVSSASRHHQAVRDLAPGFTAVAHADDGIIEAIAGRGHFGIQWHAESDETANRIYSEFMKLCQPRRAPLTPSRKQLLSYFKR
jgi:putative glutamine amidotransferase